jgi:TonB family protein
MTRSSVTLALVVLFGGTHLVSGLSATQEGDDSANCGRVLSLLCAGSSGDARLLIQLGNKDEYWTLVVQEEYRSDVTARLGDLPSERLVCLTRTGTRISFTPMVLQDPQHLVVKDAGTPGNARTPVFSTCNPSVRAPIVIREVRPNYAMDDVRAGVSGTVVLHAIVDEGGRPIDVRVVRSLSPGLDAEARNTFAQWRFRPAMRDGKPVAVAVTGEFQFRTSS